MSSWHRVDDIDVPDEGRVHSVKWTAGRRAAPVRRQARRAREPLPAPGRPARRGLDREGPAALPVARLRLRPAHRPAARRLLRRGARYEVEERADGVYVELPDVPPPPGPSPTSSSRRWSLRGHARVRHGRPLQSRLRRRLAPGRGAGELTYIGIRHEGAAAFAASAYGKLTGRPAACFAIAGPGSTNLLTGLYDAKLDDSPSSRSPARCRRQSSGAAPSRTSTCPPSSATSPFLAGRAGRKRPRRTRRAGGQARYRRPWRRASRAARRGAGAALRAPAAPPAGRLTDAAILPDERRAGRAAALVRDASRPVLIVGHGARGRQRRSRRWPSGSARPF